MIANIKNKALLPLLVFAVMPILFFELPRDLYNMRLPAFFFLLVAVVWYEYNRGYHAGKAYYTEVNPQLPLKAAPDWDHILPLSEVVKTHPFCYMELDHAPCVENDYPLPSGTIHLVQNTKGFTTLTLTDEGWSYAADTTIGKDVLRSGKFKALLTEDAMRISQDKDWELYL